LNPNAHPFHDEPVRPSHHTIMALWSWVNAAHAARCTARHGVGSCAVPAAAMGSWLPLPPVEHGDPLARAVRPRVLRLMTISNFVGCSMGKSAPESAWRSSCRWG